MKRYTLLPLIISIITIACSDPIIPADNAITEPTPDVVDQSAFIAGEMRIKVSEELCESLEANTNNQGILTRTAVTRADEVLSSIGVKHLQRTFPYAGRFEARTRAAGLHRWYDVYFDEEQSLTRANSALGAIEGVEKVEYRPITIHTGSNRSIPVTRSTVERDDDMPFNDPMLPDQWHYNNTGKGKAQIVGADINLFPAWREGNVGDKKVVVCVVDMGVDSQHEDLAPNIWVNEAEVNGVNGVDDDENGKIDDFNGYNFITNNGNIRAGEHGTHVAGTIAAVNNNGIGVSGVAGGDAAKGIPGASIMSAEIFRVSDYDPEITISASGAPAIKYGADAGAVISQNSWGYEKASIILESDKEAIDYFIKNAGFDEYGEQVGPMAGGVVIFSAGNESRTLAIPGMYEPVVCVTAITADYTPSYYTNFGTWADIASTGGDYISGNMILSTTPDNTYAEMQGTSMAAPHVTGVAALIISKYGGKGFTPQELKDRLYYFSRDISKYHSTAMTGKMGNLMDTYSSLMEWSHTAPQRVESFSTENSSNRLISMVEIPTDSDDPTGLANGVTLYYSTEEFDSSLDRENLPKDIYTKTFFSSDIADGEEALRCEIDELEFDTPYYLAFDAFDQSRNRSELSDITTSVSGSNNPPVIEPLSGTTFEVAANATLYIQFKCYDPDGHSTSLSLDAGSNAMTIGSMIDDLTQKLVLNAPYASDGNYTATLTLTDRYGLSATQKIEYTILKNNPPFITAEPEDIVITELGKSVRVDLATIFADADGDQLSYSAYSSASNIAQIISSNNNIYITAKNYGDATITIAARDSHKDKAITTFEVRVPDPAVAVEIYPNPVINSLNIRVGYEVESTIEIYNGSGGVVYSAKDMTITPFTPAQIDLSTLAAGSYTIKIEYNNNTFTRNIVKL